MPVDLNNISLIPGTECLGDSRDRINDNVFLLKQAILDLSTNAAYTTAVSFMGTTSSTSITADNTFIEVQVVLGGTTQTKYLRLFDI